MARPIPHGLLSRIPAGLFLGVGLPTLRDYGMAWDEAETLKVSAPNLRMLRGIVGRYPPATKIDGIVILPGADKISGAASS